MLQTVLMMFIRVVLEAFLLPNALMLKDPSSREADTCSRVKKRHEAHAKRILHGAKSLETFTPCFKETDALMCADNPET